MGETTTVTFTATDDAGNESTVTSTVTVSPEADVIPPVIAAPADISVDAVSAAGTPATTSAIVNFLGAFTVSDDKDPSPSVINDAPSTFELGPTLVTFTATDASGNESTATATVTVADMTAPTVTAPAPLMIEANTATGADVSLQAIVDFLAGAIATDGVDPDATIANDAPTTQFPVGETTTVTFTATDDAGNQATATSTVTVTERSAAVQDFGDAPDDYPVTLPQGASHTVGSDPATALKLGTAITTEFDGNPSENADADSGDDGVTALSSQIAAATDTVSSFAVVASAAGKLDAWIDFDNSDSWEASEQIFDSIDVAAGANTLSYTIPAGASVGGAARFRLSTAGNLDPTGPASDGEVEDYIAAIEPAGNNDVNVTSINPGTVTIETVGDDVVVREGSLVLFQGPASLLAVLDFTGSDGDDTIELTATIADFAGGVGVQGGGGTDTVKVMGENQMLDLTTLEPGAVSGLEVVDIRGTGENGLKLSEANIAGLADNGAPPRVIADPDDTLEITDGDFMIDDSMVEDGVFFVQATSGSATIQIGGLAWTNPLNPLDVNRSGSLEPVDVLQILNQLTTRTFVQSGTQSTLIDPASLTDPFPFRFFDTSGNGELEPLDLLRVLNGLTRQGEREAPEPEPGAISLPVLSIDDSEDVIEDVGPLESTVRTLDAIFSEPESSSLLIDLLDLWSVNDPDDEEESDQATDRAIRDLLL